MRRCQTQPESFSPEHVPVLADAVLEHLAIPPGGIVVDATMGLGGHAARILEKLGKQGKLVGLDVDETNLVLAKDRLACWSDQVELRRCNFRELRGVLGSMGMAGVHAIVADLGVSSNQLADADRGLSFIEDGPLDMRLDDRQPVTAADLVNSLSERELADLFFHNSQERFSRRIARRICEVRRTSRIRHTAELAAIVCRALKVDPKARRSKIHPATRVFQALRMAVNDEIGALQALLDAAPACLAGPSTDCEGGRIAVISFHSVEDGAVKRDFRRRAAAGQYRICTKKPIVADEDECRLNPRARSAKLRVAQRVA